MSKFTFVLLVGFVLAAVAVSVQGVPLPIERLAKAARSGNWGEIDKLLSQDAGFSDWAPLKSDITSRQGGPNRQVFEKSVTVVKSSSNINGQKTEFSKGHAVINDNGKIKKYEFKP